jgi:sugar O-acyltransferase (sialic acid O-acetyltransferase NeuD family)
MIIAGTGAITQEIFETASLLGFEVLKMNPHKNSLSVDKKMINLDELPKEFLLLPIVMSTCEYPEFVSLPVDQRWVWNHKKLFKSIESLGFKNWTSIVHPSAVISPSAKIGNNVFINANCTISTNSIISDSVFVNRDVSIGHDVSIGSHTNIGPAVTVTGTTCIYDSVFIGAGAIIINGIAIGSGATVAAGSVVTRNVQNFSLVMGSPARKKNTLYRNIRRKIFALASKYLKAVGQLSLAKRIYSRLKS